MDYILGDHVVMPEGCESLYSETVVRLPGTVFCYAPVTQHTLRLWARVLEAHFVSRMGASFMTASGLPEWVAKDDDDYVAIAQKMASDRPALLALKKGLRGMLWHIPARWSKRWLRG